MCAELSKRTDTHTSGDPEFGIQARHSSVTMNSGDSCSLFEEHAFDRAVWFAERGTSLCGLQEEVADGRSTWRLPLSRKQFLSFVPPLFYTHERLIGTFTKQKRDDTRHRSVFVLTHLELLP